MLYIKEEFNLEEFEPWCGAIYVYEEIEDLDIMEEAQEYIETVFGGKEVVTLTDINDMLAFGMEEFMQQYYKEEDYEEYEED